MMQMIRRNSKSGNRQKKVSLTQAFLLLGFLLCASLWSVAQSTPATYPKFTGYVGVVHPIVTYGKNSPQYNFSGVYVGGLPTGLNIWKSAKVGFSFEFVP
jgi:hypothetical protein